MENPTLLTEVCDDEKYLDDQVTYFFDKFGFSIAKSFTQENKERFFKLLTDNESLIIKLFGNALLNSNLFLPQALKNNIDDSLVQEYKSWLEKQ